MSLGITGVLTLLKLKPPAESKLAVKNTHNQIVGYLDMKQNKPWLDWFNSLMKVGQQVVVTGPLTFGLVAAQSSASLAIIFTIGGVFVPKASFVQVHCEPSPPANTCITADVFADNVIAIRFNNYSAAGVNPGVLNFDCLVTIPASQ